MLLGNLTEFKPPRFAWIECAGGKVFYASHGMLRAGLDHLHMDIAAGWKAPPWAAQVGAPELVLLSQARMLNDVEIAGCA